MAYEGPHPFPVHSGGTGAATLTGVLVGNGTSAVTGNPITQHDVLVAGSSNAITSVSPSTSGFVLTSNGTSSDPSFQAATGGSGGAKAWAMFTVNGGGAATITTSFNVTSITGSGTWTVTLTSGFSSSNYVILAMNSTGTQNGVSAASITNSTTFGLSFGTAGSVNTVGWFACFGT